MELKCLIEGHESVCVKVEVFFSLNDLSLCFDWTGRCEARTTKKQKRKKNEKENFQKKGRN